MQEIRKKINDESGAMLIGVVLVLVAVTAIGVTLVKMSTFELDISISEKCKEEARYNSESCTISGAKLIKHIMTEASDEGFLGIPEGDNRVRGITYADPVSGGTKQSELAMKILAPDQSDNVCEDFTLTPGAPANNMDAGANILPTGADANIGTAANRQISGYSYGIGLGGAGGGGFSNWFLVACRGGGCNRDGSHVSYTRYKRVPGIKGGF